MFKAVDYGAFGPEERAVTVCSGKGLEDVKGKTLPGGQPPKSRPTLTKAELREQAEAALIAWRASKAPKDR